MKPDKFSLAPEVELVAHDLIEDHHSHLIGARIKYLFRHGKWEKKHRQTLGQAKLAAEDIRFIAEFDFIITVSLDAWNYADSGTRMALVDHELYHCQDTSTPDDDEPSWGISDHDVQEFVAVVSRYGLWEKDLVRLMEAAQNQQNTVQGRLFDKTTGEILTHQEAIDTLMAHGEVGMACDAEHTATLHLVKGQ